MFEGSIILVTGGTGSWGYELTKKLLRHNPKEVRIFSRNEYAQVRMQRHFRFHPALRFLIGDVRDLQAVTEACAGVDYVFHLAALKHVPICEAQPDEALKTNVTGTSNVIRASILHRVKKVVDVSTDKACDPINFYGMTKALGEKMMIQANSLSPHTRFVCIRGGNVLGTNGSVVPFFRQLIEEDCPLTITSSEMTRFFLTIPEAIELLTKAAEEAIGGETFVMKMNACKIRDLAEVMRACLGKPHLPLQEVGVRPGEKLHEVLVSRYEAPHTCCWGDQYFVILPAAPSDELKERYAALPRAPFHEYQSDDTLLTRDEIASMLRKGGFLP